MDVAYDQITKESYPDDHPSKTNAAAQGEDGSKKEAQDEPQSFTGELKEAYTSFQSSSWGTSLNNLWGSVKKQGETYYDSAKRELATASDASRGVAESDLANSTRTLTIAEDNVAQTPAAESTSKDPQQTSQSDTKVPESLTDDIMKEANLLFSTLKSEAATSLRSVQATAGTSLSTVQLEAGKRLKQVQAAEDAADAALVRFGGSVRDYLRDAITIAAPQTGADGTLTSVLFESRDHAGRRMVHATRFDAQLHVVHANRDSFTKDPDSDEFTAWKQTFDVDKKTDAIAADLARYEPLRQAMEALVPETVEYAPFWTRYYFLRHVIEEQERKRRELLKAAETEEVGWDDDEDEDAGEGAAPATPKAGSSAGKEKSNELLKPAEGRRSNEHSVTSDASYDIVSANASRGPGSPREAGKGKSAAAGGPAGKGGDSDEEDWE